MYETSIFTFEDTDFHKKSLSEVFNIEFPSMIKIQIQMTFVDDVYGREFLMKVKKEADELFKVQKYDKALPLYEKCIKFGDDELQLRCL